MDSSPVWFWRKEIMFLKTYLELYLSKHCSTGMKCLPAAKLPHSKGVGIHDWHAEILAIRTFNRCLLDECTRSLASGDSSSGIIEHVTGDGSRLPFRVKDGVKLHMYCSEAPCKLQSGYKFSQVIDVRVGGDASMELTMADQDDGTPWGDAGEGKLSLAGELPGRAYFSQLGIVRRKPARVDAPPTMSKSCSDKLAARQCHSLLSSLTALFIEPYNAYIDTLVLPASRFSATACQRSFSAAGRMKVMAGRQWEHGFSFRPFRVDTTILEFEYSKAAVESRSAQISASNLAAAWSRSGFEETILAGVVQGRKAFDIRGASRMSRRQMWIAAKELAAQIAKDSQKTGGSQLDMRCYRDIKALPALKARQSVKSDVRSETLTGWVRNEGDSDFEIA